MDKLTYVKDAEKVIQKMKNEHKTISTNKIRDILALINELYSQVRNQNVQKLNEDLQSRIQYTKMKLVYEAGRDDNVKKFLTCSNLLEYLDQIKDSKETLLLVCHYTEALVAYHKYHKIDSDKKNGGE